MLRKFLFIFVSFVLLITVTIPGSAQTQPDLPIYIVQSGDTLGTIAENFGVPVNDIIRANSITNANALTIGTRLKIPGIEGVSGTLIRQAVPLGETFNSLAVRYQVPVKTLLRLNRVTSPQELYAGVMLILPENGTAQAQAILSSGQSMLEASSSVNSNPWTTILTQQYTAQSDNLPGDVLFTKQADLKNEISSISPVIKNIQINPLPLVQGKTTVIRIQTTKPVTLSGKLAGKDLHFFPEKENSYVAILGIYALATPGLTTLALSGSAQDETNFNFEKMLILKSGFYPNDPPLTVDPKTIDPEVTGPEEKQFAQIIAPVTPTKYWTQKFRVPVDAPVCYKSTFGNRRSYNGGPFNSFHGGTDYGVCATLNIYAPGDGVVVFAGPLTVRGNATIIDHGWGVYSGYWHQKEIKVQVGDRVKAGQLIGLIGATGRVTGPHLHWEIIINGIQVEPVDWLERTYP
jgi:murein DD-endopeptidase MepM/ murein hydrolase activator NlpD